jgi:hypothetical protein
MLGPWEAERPLPWYNGIMEYCPITGEPMPDPGQRVSRAALRRLRTSASDLNTLMSEVHNRLGKVPSPEVISQKQKQKPKGSLPLDINLVDLVHANQRLLSYWAMCLDRWTGSETFLDQNDWGSVQKVFVGAPDQTMQWDRAPEMVSDVLGGIQRLEKIIDTPVSHLLSGSSLENALASLPNQELLISNAVEAVRLLTGVELKHSTVRVWKHRGVVTSVGNPPRYLVQDLIDAAGLDLKHLV